VFFRTLSASLGLRLVVVCPNFIWCHLNLIKATNGVIFIPVRVTGVEFYGLGSVPSVCSVYHTTTLTYSQVQIRSSFTCRWHPSIHILYLRQTLHDLYLKQLGDCLSDVSDWMINNRLRLNANKTDVINIGTSRKSSKLTRFFHTKSLDRHCT